MSGKVKQDYVKSASYLFLDKFDSIFNHDPSGVLFNKYLTLLNTNLKNELGLDIKLAHCWYRWGDVVVKQSMPYIQWNHSDLNMTTVSFIGDICQPSKANSKVMDYIASYADSFISQYGDGREGVEMAIDEVYQHAPLDFQRDYRKLRESLKISRSNMPYNNREDYIASLFNGAMDSYPKSGFNQMKPQKDSFEAVFRYSLDNGVSNDDLFEIAEDFWFFFCYHLRIRYNENVRREIVNSWKERIPLETSRYDASIQNYASQFCGDSKDPVILSLLEQREERLSELDGLMKDLEW